MATGDKRRRFAAAAVLTGAVLSPGSAHGQAAPAGSQTSAFVLQQRAAQERVTADFDAQMAQMQRAAFDWGGWYSFHVFVFDDGVESSRTLRRHDLRLWGRAVLDDGTHEVYFRVRTGVVDFNSGDAYDRDENDLEGPNLERGLYRLNLGRALAGLDGTLTVGRDLVFLGTGLSLATPLDHVDLTTNAGNLEVRAIAGRTVGSSQDFDMSRPIDRSRRWLFGAQATYRRFETHRPFAYVLWQRDRNSDPTLPLKQDFDYDSFYFGIGSRGELADQWRYTAEAVFESGAGSNAGPFAGNNEIEAFSASLELEYLFDDPCQSRISAGYLFGSGDSDRRISPTDTLGGNVGDHSDDGFVSLGYHDTGLAFAPLYSNLHAFRIGGSFFPAPNHERFRRLELGMDWYLFHKHHRDGAISDPTADATSGYLGNEVDWRANWRITPDLAWTARFGAFFPGEAFGDQTARTFLLFGFVWSF